VQNIKPLVTPLFINLLVTSIFILINPIYALVFTVIISLFGGRVNSSLLGILFVLSFALVFTNQVYVEGSDIQSYLHMYRSKELNTYSDLFILYVKNINGHEFLWFYYSKFLGSISNFSEEFFVLTTYTLILSLSAIAAYLASENDRNNFSLFLFSLVFFEMTLFSNIYDLWRTIVASLLFIIALFLSNSDKPKYLFRIIMYSACFVHSTVILLVILYEVFSFFMNKKEFKLNNNLYFFKFIFIIIVSIIALSFVTKLLPYLSYFNDTFLQGFQRYSDLNTNIHFNISDYLSPIYFFIIFYIIVNYKYIKNYEAFALYAFIVVTTMPYVANEMAILYYRASIVPLTLLALMSIKSLTKLPIIYTLFFVVIIFTVRMLTFISGSFPNLNQVAKGDFLNLNYGLLSSLFYFYDPIFK
jgi:hypothetical protein